jgi:hypothetical protein
MLLKADDQVSLEIHEPVGHWGSLSTGKGWENGTDIDILLLASSHLWLGTLRLTCPL